MVGHRAFSTQLRLPGTFQRMQRAIIQTGIRYPHIQQASPNCSWISDIMMVSENESFASANKY